MSPKVLHVSESNEWSGGAAQLLALARGLREKRWDVRVACRPGSGLESKASEAALPTFLVGLKEDYDLFSAWRLACYIRREAIDVVHAHHNRAHAVCLMAKALLFWNGAAPVLVVSRRVSFAPGKNPFSIWKYRSALIDRVLAVADAVKDVLTRSGVPAQKVSVIRSGVDLNRYAPKTGDAALKRALGLPEDRRIIGKIANASPWKGQGVFLEAAALLVARGRPVHFLLAGRDTKGDWVKGEVARLGLEERVTLAGFRTDVPELLAFLSISVNAATQGEGLSGALRESLSMGVPVVASDIAGNRELLQGEGGPFLYPPGDAKALADRIEWVLENPRAAEAAVAAWRSRAQAEFSVEQTVDKTDLLYRELLSSKSAP